jgi:hypothetical protein
LFGEKILDGSLFPLQKQRKSFGKEGVSPYEAQKQHTSRTGINHQKKYTFSFVYEQLRDMNGEEWRNRAMTV